MPNAPTHSPAAQQAANARVPLPLRNDTILGVCEAIGREFGFHPNWLRVTLAATVLVSPIGALAAYAVLAVIVGASFLLFRDKRMPAGVAAAVRAPDAANGGEELPIAA